MSLRELLAHEDAPEDDVSIETALLGHPENAAIQLLPLCKLLRCPGTRFGKVLRLHHVRERMQRPQRDRVEAVVDHHVEERFPELQIANSCIVLIERGARSIGIPGCIELDRTEGECRLVFECRQFFESNPVAQLFTQRQRAIDQPARIAASHLYCLAIASHGERFRRECRLNQKIDANLGPHLHLYRIAAFAQRFSELARRVRGLGRILVEAHRDVLSRCDRYEGEQQQSNQLLHVKTVLICRECRASPDVLPVARRESIP